jgi:predicted phage tail protein
MVDRAGTERLAIHQTKLHVAIAWRRSCRNASSVISLILNQRNTFRNYDEPRELANGNWRTGTRGGTQSTQWVLYVRVHERDLKSAVCVSVGRCNKNYKSGLCYTWLGLLVSCMRFYQFGLHVWRQRKSWKQTNSIQVLDRFFFILFLKHPHAESFA